MHMNASPPLPSHPAGSAPFDVGIAVLGGPASFTVGSATQAGATDWVSNSGVHGVVKQLLDRGYIDSTYSGNVEYCNFSQVLPFPGAHKPVRTRMPRQGVVGVLADACSTSPPAAVWPQPHVLGAARRPSSVLAPLCMHCTQDEDGVWYVEMDTSAGISSSVQLLDVWNLYTVTSSNFAGASADKPVAGGLQFATYDDGSVTGYYEFYGTSPPSQPSGGGTTAIAAEFQGVELEL